MRTNSTSTFEGIAMISLMASVVLIAPMGCSAGKTPTSPPCDTSCQDAAALRGIRLMMKLAYNRTLQCKDAGTYPPQPYPSPLGGTVSVSGTATANADQGDTFVDLTYAFDACRFLQKSATPAENYDITITASLTEKGVLSQQPSSTTSLDILTVPGMLVTMSGTVYDPPIDYHAMDCAMTLTQNGNNLSGLFCGRTAGFSF